MKVKGLDIVCESSTGLLKRSSFTAVSAANFEISAGKIIGLVGEWIWENQLGKSSAKGHSFSSRKYPISIQG